MATDFTGMLTQYGDFLVNVLYAQFLAFMATAFFTILVEDVCRKGGKWSKVYILSLLLTAWPIMLQYHGWIVLPYTVICVYTSRKYGDR